jgi:hypothetical protein
MTLDDRLVWTGQCAPQSSPWLTADPSPSALHAVRLAGKRPPAHGGCRPNGDPYDRLGDLRYCAHMLCDQVGWSE